MKNGRTYLIFAVASLMSIGCDVHDVYESHEKQQEGTKPIAVHMSKASGMKAPAADSDYVLRFWTGSFADSWTMTLGEGNVDSYNYGINDLPVTGGRGVYPYDDSPVYAVGYYPASRLQLSDDKTVLTLNTENADGTKDWLTQPGLVDVCTTDREQGTESRPFTSSIENELQFRHTQVRLNFRYKRSVNLNGRIAQIWVTIPRNYIPNTWTYTAPSGNNLGGYLPSANYTAEQLKEGLSFTSTEDWYQRYPDPDGYDMYYSYALNPSNQAVYQTTDLKYSYVLAETPMFGPREINGTQVQHITFRINAVIISNDTNIETVRINEDVTMPLRKKDGTFWTSTVEGGDAFTITITIEQNRLELWAQRTPWEPGGWYTIPLNPNDPDEHEGTSGAGL